MAKPRGVNQKAAYKQHAIRIGRYADRVQQVYDTLSSEVAQMVNKTSYDGDKPFRFADYPATKRAFEDVQAKFVDDIRAVIYSGTSDEWKESNIMQDLLVEKVMKFYRSKANKQNRKVYYQTNSDALKAFQERREKGMNLSQRLWNQSKEYKDEMESCISVAVQKGMSAVTLSKKLSKYLHDFPKLKADYKEKYGFATNVHDCEYRSVRVARTEINMAYRMAEQERWKQFDFVLGYEVKLTQNGRHVPDICDDLKGKYPKTFVFKGWHPNCMCYVIPILKTEEQFWNEEKVEPVQDVPQGMKDWVADNKDRIIAARAKGTLSYWIEDNENYIMSTHKYSEIQKSAADIRHAKRTAEDIEDIKTRWNNWKQLGKYEKEKYRNVMKNDGYGNISIAEIDKMLKSKDMDYWDLWDKLDNENEKYLETQNALLQTKIDLGNRVIGLRKVKGTYIGLSTDGYPSIKDAVQQLLNEADAIESIGLKATGELLNKAEKLMNDYDSNLLPVVKLKFTIPAAKITEKNGKALLERIDALMGSNGNQMYGFGPYRDRIKAFVDKGEEIDDATFLGLFEFIKKGPGAIWRSLYHLNELANATDLYKIPKSFRHYYNVCMDHIKSADIAKNGVLSAYNDIEGAYNVYKLALNPDAKKYGFAKISPKFPHQIFEVWKDNGYSFSTMPDMAMFKKIDRYIPLVHEKYFDADFDPKNDAFFSPKFSHVVIHKNYLCTSGRSKGDKYNLKKIFAHEYGHAIDEQRGLCFKTKIREMFDDYSSIVNADKEDIKSSFWKIFNDMKKEYAKDEKTNKRFSEMAAATSDTIQAMLSSHEKWYGGHDPKYFSLKINCLSEVIAHMSENYWIGNPFFQRLFPKMYKEMNQLMRTAYFGTLSRWIKKKKL